MLTSPKSHTLQKDTTPSSWRQRESTKRNGEGDRRHNEEDKTQDKTGVKIRKRNIHASKREAVWTASEVGLTDRGFNSTLNLKNVIYRRDQSLGNRDGIQKE